MGRGRGGREGGEGRDSYKVEGEGDFPPPPPNQHKYYSKVALKHKQQQSDNCCSKKVCNCSKTP